MKRAPALRSTLVRLLAAALFLSSPSWAGAPPAVAAEPTAESAAVPPAAPGGHAAAIAAVRELAARDESALTYLDAVIAASRVVEPGLDEAKIRKQVGEIAARVRAAVADGASAGEKVAAMNRVIFREFGFRTDAAVGGSSTSGQGALDASLLHRVLDRRKGVCLGLATVYLVVAELAGMPVHPVHAPGHIYCRYEEGVGTLLEERVNIECTAGGIARSDEAVARRVGATPAARRSDVYFRRATRKDVLTDHLNNLAYDLASRKAGPAPLEWAQLVEVIDLAVKLRPKSHEIIDTAALVHFRAGNPVRALALCDQAIALCREFGAPAEVLPFYRRRRAELERAVQAAKEKTGQPGKGAAPVPAPAPADTGG